MVGRNNVIHFHAQMYMHHNFYSDAYKICYEVNSILL